MISAIYLGVGKSATIKAMAYHAEKILKKEGQKVGSPRVLLCAQTGKAANLIGKIYPFRNTDHYIYQSHVDF